MTTFGGQTIPPLFSGADAVRVQGTGAFFTTLAAGNGQTALGFPPRSIGNLLLVQGAASVNLPAPIDIANWTDEGNSGSNINKLWSRTATGDALDTFTVPAAVGGTSIWQMVSFITPSVFTRVSFGPTLPGVADLNIGTPLKSSDIFGPDTLIIGISWKRATANSTIPVIADDNVIDKLSSLAFFDAGANQVMYMVYGWQFQAVNAAVSAGSYSQAPTVSALVRGKLYRFG